MKAIKISKHLLKRSKPHKKSAIQNAPQHQTTSHKVALLKSFGDVFVKERPSGPILRYSRYSLIISKVTRGDHCLTWSVTPSSNENWFKTNSELCKNLRTIRG
jgi:hypothetical protein